jgi:transcriptional regulator with XRE-family HTH domain
VAGEPSPTLRRRELASRLRELRLTAGLTVDDVARRLYCSPAKVSRIETGSRAVALRDVQDLCRLYQVHPAECELLMELARQSRERSWWQAYDVPYKTYIGLEIAAAKISTYLSAVVPGLLQTEDYARALVAGMVPGLGMHQIRQAVDVRLIRQKILTRDNPPQLHVVIDEASLHRTVGGATTMFEQLQTVIARASLPNVTIQVIPFEAGPHPGMDSPFTILEYDEDRSSDVVYVEGLIGNIYLERPEDLQRYRRVFDHLKALAFGSKDSLGRIEQIAQKYEQ